MFVCFFFFLLLLHDFLQLLIRIFASSLGFTPRTTFEHGQRNLWIICNTIRLFFFFFIKVQNNILFIISNWIYLYIYFYLARHNHRETQIFFLYHLPQPSKLYVAHTHIHTYANTVPYCLLQRTRLEEQQPHSAREILDQLLLLLLLLAW